MKPVPPEQKIKPSNKDESKISQNDVVEGVEELKENNEIEAQEESVQEEVAIINSLTSFPFSDESPLLVLAICGPYSAMQKFKYKV